MIAFPLSHLLNKDIPIGLIGEKFDLTFDYQHLGNDLNVLKSKLNSSFKTLNIE